MKRKLLFALLMLLLAALVTLTSCDFGGGGTGGGGSETGGGETEEKDYTVTFIAGKNKESVGYDKGETPAVPKKLKAPKNYSIAGWDREFEKVSGDATYTAILNSGTYVSDDILMAAYRYEPITYIPGDPYYGGLIGGNVLDASYAFLVAVLEENASGQQGGPLRDNIVSKLRFMIAGGHEQICDACCYWSYCMTTAAIALCKATDSVWGELTEDEVAAFDCMMRAYACMESFATADYNDYLAGPGRNGNYNKGWNPNYRLANVPVMLWCSCYFGDCDPAAGAEEVDKILNDFNYDTYMEEFRKFGFTNMYWCWSAMTDPDNPVNQMMEGGALTLRVGTWNGKAGDGAGTGVGVRPARYNETDYTGYVYEELPLSDWKGIFNTLLAFCFSGGKVEIGYGEYTDPDTGETKYTCYTMSDGELNPVLDKLGMMYELVGSDTGGLRSSTVYCQTDFNLAVGMVAAAEALGMWNHVDESTFDRITVGNDDLVYKRIKGYHGFSGGNAYDTPPDDFSQGHHFMVSMWINTYSRACEPFLSENEVAYLIHP